MGGRTNGQNGEFTVVLNAKTRNYTIGLQETERTRFLFSAS